MKTRIIDIHQEPNLYDTFMSWWKAHDWPGVAIALLPKCGILVENESQVPCAVTWLYMDNSVGVSMMEWTVTNPDLTAMQSYKALTEMIKSVRKVANSLDYGIVLTTAKQKSLVKCYSRNGFELTDTGITHLVMVTR